MKILSTLRPAFFPDLLYFWQMFQSDVVIWTDHLQFSKGGTINRSAPLHGEQDILTIPVRHDQKPLPIAAKQMDEQSPWRQKHLKTLHHLFHHFPFVEYYLPQIEDTYRLPEQNLGNFLFSLTKQIVHWLHLPVQLVRSSQLPTNEDATESVLTWCEQFACQAYVSQSITFEKGWIKASKLKIRDVKPLIFAPLPASSFLNTYAWRSIIPFILQFGPEAGYILKQFSWKDMTPSFG